MLLPWVLCAMFGVVITILTIKIILLKKSMIEIVAEFENCLSEDTNVQITVSSSDKTVRKLAKAINFQLSELRKLKQRYSNGDRELKEAVTNISHDLRTPLTAICGYLDLLQNKELSDDTARCVEQLRNRSEDLKKLTEELFCYSVISSTPELKIEKVNLCCVLEETLISFYGAMKSADISPKIQIPCNPIFRDLDYSALTRIFSNIINNAMKYSDGDFEVCLQEDGVITFSNTAKQLSTVEVSKLFDRFYTVNSAGKSTGLGLSIAKLLTKRMNGSISANYDNDKLEITVAFNE